MNRDDVRQGAELIGVELGQHIDNVIEAMRGIAWELGFTARQISGGSAASP